MLYWYNAKQRNITLYITYGKIIGGTPIISIFWLFLKNGSVSEQTVYRAVVVHIALSKKKKCMKKNSSDLIFTIYQYYTLALKGKFSSGIEGALASTLNHDFNWKQLSEIILCIFLLMFSKFIWVTLIQKQQKYK